MADSVVIKGVLVGAEARPYSGFSSPEGAVPAGVTRWLYVSTSFGSEPVRIKVRNAFAAQFDALALLGLGTVIECVCTLFARGDKIERQYNEHRVLASAQGEVAAASNGRR